MQKLHTSLKERFKALKTKMKEPYNIIKKELSNLENALQTDAQCIYRRVNLAEVKKTHSGKVSLTFKMKPKHNTVLQYKPLSYEIHHKVRIYI